MDTKNAIYVTGPGDKLTGYPMGTPTPESISFTPETGPYVPTLDFSQYANSGYLTLI